MSAATESKKPLIGIFAIQGAVEEHANLVKKCGGDVKEIRLPKDFEGIDGIILPGGESTTMAIVGERWGLFPKLKDWVAEKKPIWGTCAGMILLSDHAIKQARCGQSLVGGLDVHVCRNFFGSQIYSCQVDISLDPSTTAAMSAITTDTSSAKCPAVFIRAPAILSVGPDVDVLASMVAKPHTSARADVLKLIETAKGGADSNSSATDSAVDNTKRPTRVSSIIESTQKTEGSVDDSSFEVFVAVRQGNILATAFHPELTEDTRWHQYFMSMVAESKQ